MLNVPRKSGVLPGERLVAIITPALHRTTPALHQYYTSTTPALHQHYTSATPALHQHYTSTTPALHQHYTSTTPALHQHYTSTTPALHQHYTSTTPALPVYPFSFDHNDAPKCPVSHLNKEGKPSSINASAVCEGAANIHIVLLHGSQDKVWWSDPGNVDQLAKSRAEMQQGQCNLWVYTADIFKNGQKS
ncbi:hypothetical protein EMCRGX_G008584 [Ephydatia muelleri]